MTIQVNEKTIGLHWGMMAVEDFFKKVSTGERIAVQTMVELVWAGVENWFYRERKEPDVTFAEIYDFVESQMLTESGRDYLNRIYKSFEDSQAVKALAETGKQSKKKK